MTEPWPQPATPEISEALTHALLQRITEDITSLNLSDQDRHKITTEASPWLALWATAGQEDQLDDLVQQLVYEIKQYGQDQTLDLLREHALAARISTIDQWITKAVQQASEGDQARQALIQQANDLDEKLNALDDQLLKNTPTLRQAFADQLSEMYLDLEYLISGISGSLRHQHLFHSTGGAS